MADVDPFADDLQQADSRAPAEADLEQSLAQLLTSFSTLTNCQSALLRCMTLSRLR